MFRSAGRSTAAPWRAGAATKLICGRSWSNSTASAVESGGVGAARARRQNLPPGLEAWAGNPWFVVTGDSHRAQALWSFAHGMVILELDDRYPPGSDLDGTWRAGAAAFEGPVGPG